MKCAWFAKFPAVLVMMLVAAPATADSDLWLHIRVEEEDGAKVRVNVPLDLVEKSVPLISKRHAHRGRVVIDEVDMTVEDLRQLWQELKDSPEMTFLTVEDKHDRIEVSKRGGYVLVRVEEHDDGEKVDVRIPEPLVDALLSGEGDTLDVTAALRALAEQGEGELVTVADGGDRVRVWLDRSAEAE